MQEEVVKYEVNIRKDTTTKNLYFYTVKSDGAEISGQALGLGPAMMQASDAIYGKLESEGRTK